MKFQSDDRDVCEMKGKEDIEGECSSIATEGEKPPVVLGGNYQQKRKEGGLLGRKRGQSSLLFVERHWNIRSGRGKDSGVGRWTPGIGETLHTPDTRLLRSPLRALCLSGKDKPTQAQAPLVIRIAEDHLLPAERAFQKKH